MKDENFEWDDTKAASNLIDHKLSFEKAIDAFSDPFSIEFVDSREHYGEERYMLIGMMKDRLISVVYTMREDRIRIISARKAEPHENRRYHEANTDR